LATPSWANKNLEQHHSKRLRETPGCFEDLLGLSDRSMTVAEYQDRSRTAVSGSWCEYEAQGRDFVLSTYIEPRAFYIDDDLVVAITDVERFSFVTCFHEHFDSRRSLHGKNPGRSVSVAQRRLRYLDDLRIKEKGRLVINLRVIRDGQPSK
jgi:hypothetical protein